MVEDVTEKYRSVSSEPENSPRSNSPFSLIYVDY